MRIRDAFRALLVLAGVGVVAVAASSLATMPPPPPGGRDIPGGFAVIFLGVAVLVGVFLAVGGLALSGDGDPLFRGHQRTVLRAVGYLLAGSVVFGIGVAVTVDVLLGLVVPGLTAVLFLPVALGVLCWRAGEALFSAVGGNAS